MLGDQSFKIWKGIVCALYAVAVASTVVRIWHRYGSLTSRRSLWWDDLLAVLASLLGIAASVIMVQLYQETDSHEHIAWQKRLYWAMSVVWVSIIWLSRIGLALHLSRTVLPQTTPWRVALGTGLLFSLVYIANLSWIFVGGCTHYGRVYNGVRTTAYCNGGQVGVNLVKFVVLFISDAALMIVAFYVYIKRTAGMNFHIVNSQQRRSREVAILRTLGGAFIMLLTTIAHCSVYYSPLVTGTGGLLTADMTNQLEAALSILACNIPVLVAAFRWAVYHEAGFLDSPQPNWTPALAKPPIGAGVNANVITLADLARDRENRKQAIGADDASSISGYSLAKVQPLPIAHAA